jgi:N-acetylneuraminic acid mutarotase
LTWQTLQTVGTNEPPAVAEAQSVVADGELFVFGGYDVTTPDYQPTNAAETFNPNTNTWSAIAPMPAPETHMGVATDRTYIYIAGGYTFDPVTTYQTFATTNVFQYDIATNTWANYVPLPQARGAGALVYLDGQLHFMDGVNVSRTGQIDHWVLNPSDSNPQWTESTPMQETSNHTAAVVLNGKIVVVGGQATKDDNTTIAKVWEWDPSNPAQWTALASMPYAASHAVVDVYDNRIIVAGGTTNGDVPLNSVIVYDPDTNSWSDQTNLPDNGRLAAVGGVIGNQIIVALGFGNGGLQNQTWEAIAT